jgi:hypothetical protein
MRSSCGAKRKPRRWVDVADPPYKTRASNHSVAIHQDRAAVEVVRSDGSIVPMGLGISCDYFPPMNWWAKFRSSLTGLGRCEACDRQAHAARPGRPLRAELRAALQMRIHEPRRLDQGPHRLRHDRGRRAPRPAQTRRHDRRGDRQQYRPGARDDRRDQWIQAAARVVLADPVGSVLANLVEGREPGEGGAYEVEGMGGVRASRVRHWTAENRPPTRTAVLYTHHPEPTAVVGRESNGKSRFILNMNVKEQIKKHITSQPEPKCSEMQELHRLTLQVLPKCKLWFFDGKDSNNKAIANPTIGYGLHTIKYADGTTRDFFQIGMAEN